MDRSTVYQQNVWPLSRYFAREITFCVCTGEVIINSETSLHINSHIISRMLKKSQKKERKKSDERGNPL